MQQDEIKDILTNCFGTFKEQLSPDDFLNPLATIKELHDCCNVDK